MTDTRSSQLWVEIVGGIIVARLRGGATEDLLRECLRRITELQRDTGCTRVLYDALELERPTLDVTLTQQALSDELKHPSIKVAIVVPNTGIAYLARLAFGAANHRVVYNDMALAIRWLTEE